MVSGLSREERAVISPRNSAQQKKNNSHSAGGVPRPVGWNLASDGGVVVKYDKRAEKERYNPSYYNLRPSPRPRRHSFPRRNASNSSSSSCWLF